MIDIQAGDVVVCVDVGPRPWWTAGLARAARRLRAGRAYRVSSVGLSCAGNPVLRLSEIRHEPSSGFCAERFRKVYPATKKFTTQIKAIRPIREDA